MTIIEALADEALFKRWLVADSWHPADFVLYLVPLEPDERETSK